MADRNNMNQVDDVQYIEPHKLNLLKPKRVAAYCRVSTDSDDMLHSLAQQVGYYNDYISSRPDWRFAGIYADRGISGTLNNRPEFLRMMEDARKNKFDLIITKSVTRFARNTVTLLSSMRELKELGIDIYFEKENMHSISPDGELLITLLAMYAEEEARSTSENVRWRIKKKFENGEPTYTKIYGYRWVDDHFEIVPEEAKVVKRIFELYLSGMGRLKIAKTVSMDPELGLYDGKPWRENHIAEILRNEKYMGDILLQKTYTPDFRTKRKKLNTGQVPQYLVKGAHEPIIPPEVFAKVQAEIMRRSKLVPPRKIPESELFKGLVRCKCCGFLYIRKHRPYDDKKYFWTCNGYKLYGKDHCNNKEIREEILIKATKEALKLDGTEELTGKLIKDNIEHMEALEGNKLRFFLCNGRVETIYWQTPSRSESWTPEMKKKAKEDCKRGNEMRRASQAKSTCPKQPES